MHTIRDACHSTTFVRPSRCVSPFSKRYIHEAQTTISIDYQKCTSNGPLVISLQLADAYSLITEPRTLHRTALLQYDWSYF
jgi:hypothetical protein